MNSFIFAANATLPIVLTVALGYFIKRLGIVTQSVASSVNKIVFRVLLPAMLFVNIYEIESIGSINLTYVGYVIGITVALFLIFIPIVSRLFSKRNQRGVILQAIFRSNYALVGIPLAEALFGSEGVALASILAAFIIPVFNILAVICLSIYSDEKRPSVRSILIKILQNPLIISVVTALLVLAVRALFVRLDFSFRLSDAKPLFKVLKSLSSAATPMALLALGAQFEFSAIPALKRQIIFGIAIRNAFIPAAALSIAYAMGIFEGAHFATFVAMFTTPVAVSSVPMAESMGADHRLAGQIVIWTTILSSVTIFLASLILKSLGVF